MKNTPTKGAVMAEKRQPQLPFFIVEHQRNNALKLHAAVLQ
ncbi:hypothetical protein RNAN_0854 [Rheinheimera nanhaiensis E407-8]|uniref:Uncharacterized protein n=1 Tax=Rheinheimera nanhaiensis E407-8 TaxID=562729 RepID=I1DV06_9GAMM|nr:hypothetical protein RNAN_0854 [Rheinheimera nanhaiensis E407-8]